MYVFVQAVKNVKIDNDKRNGKKKHQVSNRSAVQQVSSVKDMLSLNSVMNHCKL